MIASDPAADKMAEETTPSRPTKNDEEWNTELTNQKLEPEQDTSYKAKVPESNNNSNLASENTNDNDESSSSESVVENEEDIEKEKALNKRKKRLKCLGAFVGIFFLFGIYYLLAQVEYSKTAEIVDGECPLYFHRVYEGGCNSRNSDFMSECYNITKAAAPGDFKCKQTKCFNKGFSNRIHDIEGYCVSHCPISILPGEDAITILKGRWCVPNCYEGGTYDIAKRDCVYPANYDRENKGVISIE